MKFTSWRIAASLLVLVASIVFILPSLPGVGSSGIGRFLPDTRINLGLDLKGGMHLTLGVDVEQAVLNSLSRSGQDLRVQASEEGITVLRSRLTPDKQLEFLLPRPEQTKQLNELLAKDFPQLSISSSPAAEGGVRYLASYTQEARTKIEEMALDQAVRTIRNRIDQIWRSRARYSEAGRFSHSDSASRADRSAARDSACRADRSAYLPSRARRRGPQWAAAPRRGAFPHGDGSSGWENC